MGIGPAELLSVHLLPRHRGEDVGPGDEHVGGPLDHEDEVRQRRRVGGPARTRAENHADLGDHARGTDVAPKDPPVAGRAATPSWIRAPGPVVQPDERCADRFGHVHDLVDLGRVRLAEGPAEDPEVLGEDEDLAPEARSPIR